MLPFCSVLHSLKSNQDCYATLYLIFRNTLLNSFINVFFLINRVRLLLLNKFVLIDVFYTRHQCGFFIYIFKKNIFYLYASKGNWQNKHSYNINTQNEHTNLMYFEISRPLIDRYLYNTVLLLIIHSENLHLVIIVQVNKLNTPEENF